LEVITITAKKKHLNDVELRGCLEPSLYNTTTSNISDSRIPECAAHPLPPHSHQFAAVASSCCENLDSTGNSMSLAW